MQMKLLHFSPIYEKVYFNISILINKYVHSHSSSINRVFTSVLAITECKYLADDNVRIGSGQSHEKLLHILNQNRKWTEAIHEFRTVN